jgi:5-bromo-4-chloroindolyl phosphate hydrolysis protein
MKTEKEIKSKLKDAEVRLKQITKTVKQSQSMNQVIASVSKQNAIEREVSILKWVLNEK